MRALVSAVIGGLLLIGCAPQGSLRVNDEAAVMRLAGGTFSLRQTLSVPAGKARVFVQDGRPVSGFDQYRPHCALEIRSVQHDGFDVTPGVFRITRVQRSLERVVRSDRLQLAGLYLGLGMDGLGSSAYHEGYHLWLDSPEQPGVMRLSCYGAYAVPYDLAPPTLGEIRAAFGSLAELEP